MTNETKICDLANKTDRVITDRNAEGKMGLHLSSQAWAKGQISLKVMTQIPTELTCAEARELGWALYMLGKYGDEISADTEHDLDDDYFMD